MELNNWPRIESAPYHEIDLFCQENQIVERKNVEKVEYEFPSFKFSEKAYERYLLSPKPNINHFANFTVDELFQQAKTPILKNYIHKNILVEGNGDMIGKKDVAIDYNFNIFIAGVEDVMASSYLASNLPTSTRLKILLTGFRLALMTMRRGEISEFVISPRLAFGSLSTPRVPSNSTIVALFELNNYYNQESCYYAMTMPLYILEKYSLQEMYEIGKECYNLAKEAYFEERYSTAVRLFNDCVKITERAPIEFRPGKAIDVQLKTLHICARENLAFSLVDDGNPTGALKVISPLLFCMPKAWFTIRTQIAAGRAYEAMARYYSAIRFYGNALRSCNNNLQIRERIQYCHMKNRTHE